MKKKLNYKRIGLLVLTVALFSATALIGHILVLTDPYWDRAGAEYEFEGKGTKKFPYQISSLEDLCYFRDLVNGGVTFSDTYFLQTQDIDLSEVDNWISIGEYGSNHYFYGDYNGDGHVLYNLTIIGSSNNALFGVLCGTVRNLGIESGYMEGGCLGAIASHGVEDAEIYNCYNKATIHGIGRAAGIADNFLGKISYCWNFGEIRCDTTMAVGISSYSAQINNCYSFRLPVVSDLFSGELINSMRFSALDEIGDLLEEVYLNMCQEGVEAKKPCLMVKDGDTITFDRRFVPDSFIRAFFADFGALLLLVVSALLLLIIALFLLKSGKKDCQNSIGREKKETDPSCAQRNARISILGMILTFVFLVGGITVANDTLFLKRRDGVTTMQNYYQQPQNSVDVLLLGSSRTGVNLNCDVLWRDYGISSYALWGSVQPFWNSYYFLNEALKYNIPSVVALEVNAATYDMEYSDDARQYANTYGMRLSLDKLEAIQVSAPQERWIDLLMGFPIYHEGYEELSEVDFTRYLWSRSDIVDKGTGLNYGIGTLENCADVSAISEVKNISWKQEEYLLKIITRCKMEGIPLLLFASPTANREECQPYFNYVANLAEAQEVPFINFNLLDDETGFTAEDFFEDNVHVNTNGARKISWYLGRYLKEHYTLKDHRGDPYYSSWEEFSVEMENAYFPMITSTEDYLTELLRDDRTVVFLRWAVSEDDPGYAFFKQSAAYVGFDVSFLDATGNCCWIMPHSPDPTEYQSYEITDTMDIPLDGYNLSIAIDSDRIISFDGQALCGIQKGLFCIVYDKYTDSIVDTCLLVDPDRELEKPVRSDASNELEHK